MRTLYLLRHAKSSWGDEMVSDFERPLNTRGRRAAEAMCHYLTENNIGPDLILCSPAFRAKETLDIIYPAVAGADLLLETGLYTFDSSILLDRIRLLAPDRQDVMIVGHNPAMQDLALLLCGRNRAETTDAFTALSEKYPTGALAVLRLELDDWREAGAGCGMLEEFIRPKDLTDG